MKAIRAAVLAAMLVGAALLAVGRPGSANSVPGGKIVFAAFAPSSYRSDIFSVDPDGTDTHNLTRTSNLDEQWPSISPSGKYVVFRSGNVDQWATTEIYTMDNHGGQLTRLTDNDAADSSPVWTPDGGTVIFMSNRNDPNHACDDWPCNWDLFSVRTDGSHRHELTNSSQQDIFPSVSPDGQWILFQRLGASPMASALYVMDVHGQHLHQVTPAALKAGGGSWSPDGSLIAFPDNTCRACGQSDLWVMHRDGTHRVRVTNTVANETNVRWSPNGHWLVFQVDLGSNSFIDRMHPDGSARTHVTSPHHGFAFEPSWGPAKP